MRAFFISFLSTALFAIEAPYGSWKSPIGAESIAQGEISFSDVKLVDGRVYWLELRPAEQGRIALVSWSKEEGEVELLPKEYSVRNRVHEYGGGSLLIAGGVIYFVNDHDQQVYCLEEGVVRKITEKGRYADGCASGKTLFYVLELNGDNSIVKIENGQVETIASGHDFYSNPRVSPDGRYLSYICWDHPNMSWDGTELWILDLVSQEKRLVAGNKAESVVDPQWSADGELYFISDRSNWWNIYTEKGPVCPMEAECAYPQWVFGWTLMGFLHDGIACGRITNGVGGVGIIRHGEFEELDLGLTFIDGLAAEGDKVALIGGSPSKPVSIILYDGETKVIKGSAESCDFVSTPIAIEFPTTLGAAHGFYYPPANPNFTGLSNEKPPLLVQSHGGPTWHYSPTYAPNILYWTSRGFGVVSVNYGGSTGYGREYRERLKGNWGIVDVDDCTNAALYCVEMGWADPNRLTIEGGSAGGYTTLAVLAYRNIFKAGADHFGVSDLEALTNHTHKFEARYLDGLVGLYPEEKQTYMDRSPIHSVETIQCPIIIFQGDEDAIVPPAQSTVMYESLKARGIPTAYLLFEGEQHGFRKAENIKRSLEAQLYFFSKVLKFDLNEDINPVLIDNL